MKLKLFIALALLCALLCACGSDLSLMREDSLPQNIGQPATTVATEPSESITETTEPTTVPTTTKDTAVTPPPSVNEFFNDSNSYHDENAVSIRPRHLYWEGDTLVAQCFVINGKASTVNNIKVLNLSFTNAQGTIAEASFGLLEGLSIAPYSNVLWTFKFRSDTVFQADGNLSSLIYRSRVTFNEY